jgi:hypothetical protein
VEYKKYVKIPSLPELLVEIKRDDFGCCPVTIILIWFDSLFKEVVGK